MWSRKRIGTIGTTYHNLTFYRCPRGDVTMCYVVPIYRTYRTYPGTFEVGVRKFLSVIPSKQLIDYFAAHSS